VLVTHPGLQHSHQLAWALEEAGHLACFWSGVPLADSANPAAEFWPRLKGGIRTVPIRRAHRWHSVAFPMLRRVVTAIFPASAASNICHRLDHAFDVWVARWVHHLKPDMVICYENSALMTFRAAKAIGAVCVLDAASVHYATARSLGSSNMRASPLWIDTQKQSEIDLADAVLTCSRLAADTYLSANVAAWKVFPMPLGTDIPLGYQKAASPDNHCRFVFAGSFIARKGIDLLLDVFEDFINEDVPAKLTLIGGGGESYLIERAKRLSNVECLPFMSQVQLFQELAGHDCFVLPSRFDSFGMVVPEAMSVGVPALVTDRVGAKCIIDQHPDAGWIVPFDADALKGQLRWLVEHRVELARASGAARRAAQDYTWPKYRERVVSTLESIYTRCRAQPIT
jgi:glycosyltransferase involved in cell wall biosynthesis